MTKNSPTVASLVEKERPFSIEAYIQKIRRITDEGLLHLMMGHTYQDWVPKPYREHMHQLYQQTWMDHGLDHESILHDVMVYTRYVNGMASEADEERFKVLSQFENRTLRDKIGRLANMLWVCSLDPINGMAEIGGQIGRNGATQAQNLKNGNAFALDERNRELNKIAERLRSSNYNLMDSELIRLTLREASRLHVLDEKGLSSKQLRRILGLAKRLPTS